MSRAQISPVVSARRELVDRVVTSPYLARSARLRDLLIYLSERVLEDPACEIHEQEVGHGVFGRPKGYDTANDNIVRVHASTLRKRLDQYFAAEGAGESQVIEIPKGNYAPVFRERPIQRLAADALTGIDSVLPESLEPSSVSELGGALVPVKHDWRLVLAGAALLIALTIGWLVLHSRGAAAPSRPTVRAFWSQVLPPGPPAAIVLDDSTAAQFQELTGKAPGLSEYFDRSYLRNAPPGAAASLVRRQSSFAAANFAWRLAQIPESGVARATLRFARDFTFRELRSGGGTVLIGNSATNPWVQPFEGKLTARWILDAASGSFHPAGAQPAHGYFSVALLPNTGNSGTVLIVSGSGGSALGVAAEYLGDDAALTVLRSKLPGTGAFPPFEALLRLDDRGISPRDAAVVYCQKLR